MNHVANSSPRRRVLAGVAATLAGCSRTRFEGDRRARTGQTGGRTDSSAPARGSTPANGRDTDGNSASDQPRTADSSETPTREFELHGTVTQQPTDRAPGRIRLSLTNRGGRPRELSLGVAPPFSGIVSPIVDGGQLVLLPIGDKAFTSPPVDKLIPDRRNDCWTTVREFDVVQSLEVRTIGPGETLSREYHALHSSDPGTCRAGTYEFDRTVDRPADDGYVPLFQETVSVRVGEDWTLSVTGAVQSVE